jgi:uncharacterized protein
MKGWFKGMQIILCAFSLLISANIAHAASFDCAKATTKVEKLICADPFISRLDGQLSKVYDQDIAKADPEQKHRLVTDERYWLKNMRGWCTTQTCFKHAYWQRLAELETFYMPHSPMYARASDKAAAIQKILKTAPLYPLKLNGKGCSGVFHAVKEMKGIRYVKPVIQAMSYGNPALIPLRKRVAKMCQSEFPQGAPITFNYQCNSGPPVPQDLESPTNALGGCLAYYGLPPFRVYKLPPVKPGDHDRYLFSLDAQYGPMNIPGEKPFWTAGGGFIDGLLPSCGRDALPEYVAPAAQNPIYKEVVEYKHQYYFLILYQIGGYWVSIHPVEGRAVCDWSPTNLYQGKK